MQRTQRRIAVSALALTRFRNHAETHLHFADGPVVITGPNGSGKTNILEALSLLSPGRGLRRATLEAMAAKACGEAGEPAFSIHANLIDEALDEPISLGTGLEPGKAGRSLRINGANQPQDVLGDLVKVAWLTPTMDGLFTGPSAERRRFLDRMVLALHPAHGRVASAFEKALRERNRLLADSVSDAWWYEGLEEELARLALALAEARVDCLRALQDENVRRAAAGGSFPHAVLSIEGTLEADVLARGPAAALEAYRAALHDQRGRDLAAGRTLEGPHRTDLLVRHGPKDMEAALSSTGEQKALLVGLVLANAAMIGVRTGLKPILLFDEIAAHFDAERRAALFAELDALGGQVFMTGTERVLFEPRERPAVWVDVRDGVARTG